MIDVHALEGTAAELRAHLLANSDLKIATAAAELVANAVNDMLNEMHIGPGTSLLARALVAQAVLGVAADWWAGSTDPRATVPVTTAVLRSFITDLPPQVFGGSYIPGSDE